MKIFNWIHRHRFPYSIHPAEVSLAEDESIVRRSGSAIRKENIERKPLLDVEADWELDRILTIGTLAIDPLLDNVEDEEGDNGEAEYSYDHNDQHDDKTDTILVKEDPKCDMERCKVYVHKLRDAVKRCSSHEIEEVEEEIMYEKLTNFGRRVTLLDLFMADELVAKKQGQADDDYVEDDDDEAKEMKKMKKKKKLILNNKLSAALGGKRVFSSKAKKKLLTDADGVPPLKKLHRFMTRMMKKKIHPDVEVRLQKKGQVKLNDDVPMGMDDGHASINGQYAAGESVFLLPTQGIAV